MVPSTLCTNVPKVLECQNIREEGKGRTRVRSIMLRPRIPKLLPYESRGRKVLIFNYVPVFKLGSGRIIFYLHRHSSSLFYINRGFR